MRNDQEQKQLQEEFPDVLEELAKLRQAIDSQVYPGRAWPVHRPISRRFLWPAIAAAAAVLVIALSLVWWLYSDGHIREPQGASETIVQVPSGDEATWLVPTNIGLSLAGSIKLDVPSVSIPSADDFGELELSVPTITFPSLTEVRSNNHEL